MKTIYYLDNQFRQSEVEVQKAGYDIDKQLTLELHENGPILQMRNTNKKSTFSILDTDNTERTETIHKFLLDNDLKVLKKQELHTYVVKPFPLEVDLDMIKTRLEEHGGNVVEIKRFDFFSKDQNEWLPSKTLKITTNFSINTEKKIASWFKYFTQC